MREGRGGLNSKDPWEAERLGQADRRREHESGKGVYSRCPGEAYLMSHVNGDGRDTDENLPLHVRLIRKAGIRVSAGKVDMRTHRRQEAHKEHGELGGGEGGRPDRTSWYTLVGKKTC